MDKDINEALLKTDRTFTFNRLVLEKKFTQDRWSDEVKVHFEKLKDRPGIRFSDGDPNGAFTKKNKSE